MDKVNKANRKNPKELRIFKDSKGERVKSIRVPMLNITDEQIEANLAYLCVRGFDHKVVCYGKAKLPDVYYGTKGFCEKIRKKYGDGAISQILPSGYELACA